MGRVQANGAQDGRHLSREIVADPGALFLGPLTAAEKAYAFGLESREEVVV